MRLLLLLLCFPFEKIRPIYKKRNQPFPIWTAKYEFFFNAKLKSTIFMTLLEKCIQF